jgi:YD repeat-containing protein
MPSTTLVKDAQGRLAYFSYAGEYIESHKDALGRVSTYDDRWADTDPLGYTSYFEYDDSLRLLYTGGPQGYGTYFQYAPTWPEFVAAETDAVGKSTYYQYAVPGVRTSRLDPKGNATYYAYNSAGLRTSVKDALGYVRQFGYDAGGNRHLEVDQLGRATYFNYDSVDRLSARVDALGNEREFAYDDADNLTSETDELGATSYYGYDNRVVRTLYPDGGYTYFECYEAPGQGPRTQLYNFAGRGSGCYSCSGHKLTSATRVERRATIYDTCSCGPQSKYRAQAGSTESRSAPASCYGFMEEASV